LFTYDLTRNRRGQFALNWKLDAKALDAVWNGLSEPIKVTMKYSRSERNFSTDWRGRQG